MQAGWGFETTQAPCCKREKKAAGEAPERARALGRVEGCGRAVAEACDEAAACDDARGLQTVSG